MSEHRLNIELQNIAEAIESMRENINMIEKEFEKALIRETIQDKKDAANERE